MKLFDDILVFGFLGIGIMAVVMAIDILIQINGIDWVKVLS